MPDVDVEAYLGCVPCKKAWFRVERHETKPDSGVFVHRIANLDGAPAVETGAPVPKFCPTCDGELTRQD